MQRIRATTGGFTLIELLVVISIIALLVSILLPALGSARETAIQIKCASQQRSIVAVVFMYQEENLQYLPFMWNGMADRPDDWTSAHDVLNPYLGLPERTPGGGFMSQSVLYDGWKCPAMIADNVTDERGGMYSPNPTMMPYMRPTGETFDIWHNPDYPNQQLKDVHITEPSSHVMWGEVRNMWRPLRTTDYNGFNGAGYADGWGNCTFPHFATNVYEVWPDGESWGDWFSVHTGRTAVGFADGHVGIHAPSDFATAATGYGSYRVESQ